MFKLLLQKIVDIPKNIAVRLIKAYQRSFSPDHGILKVFYPHGCCRFYPTCSQYGLEAITKHGFIKGGFMAAWRILRCNPFNKGDRHDPVK